VVVFAHGTGSGRFSPCNNFIARILQNAGFTTLLVDLLEGSEVLDRRKVFDIDLLADRLLANAHWLRQQSEIPGMLPAYFSASTGAGAALQAAAREPGDVAAIFSRRGRPDLAEEYLSRVEAPTMLIVGGEDKPVIPLNEVAYEQLSCPKQLVVVSGATHLFEEPGALEKVGQLARDWFIRYLLPQA
jgi:putative phosphoribosyl transferase